MAAEPDDRSSQADCRAASPASMATSVSASRCRTAWKELIGRSNWIRSRAWRRASSSILLEAPTSSWPTASRASATARAQSSGPEVVAHGERHVGADHLDQPEVGGHARRRAGGSGRRRTPPRRRRPSPVRATTTAGTAPTERCGGQAADGQAAPCSSVPGGSAASGRRQDECRPPGRDSVRGRGPATAASADEWASAGALQLEEDRHRRPGVVVERLVPPQLAEGVVEGGARPGLHGVAEAPLEEVPVGRPPSAVGPEVEQPPGDDVPLDLGRAPVDGGGP